MTRPLTGYADLLRALAVADASVIAAVADCLHFKKTGAESGKPGSGGSKTSARNIRVDPSPQDASTEPFRPIPFWRVTGYESLLESGDSEEPQAPEVVMTLRKKPGKVPRKTPLITAAKLSQKLRRRATHLKVSRTLDAEKAVDQISRGKRLERLPRQQRRSWGNRVQIICDHSVRLTPYWSDQLEIIAQLGQWFPREGIEYAFIKEGLERPVLEGRGGALKAYQWPLPGSLVIALTDLGVLDQGAEMPCARWRQLGTELRRQGCRPVALVPGCGHKCWQAAGKSWRVIPLEDSKSALPLSEAVEEVLTLCAFATRLQPGFLRAIRTLLGADAVVESLVWQHPMLTSPNLFGAPVDVEMAQERQRLWPEAGSQITARWNHALALQSHWRNGYSEELWAAEITAMPNWVQKAATTTAELTRAKHIIRQFEAFSTYPASSPGLASWVRWYLPISRSDPELDAAITRLYQRFSQDPQSPPRGYQPQFVDDPVPRKISFLAVVQVADRLAFLPFNEIDETHGSRRAHDSQLAVIRSRNGHIKISPPDSLPGSAQLADCSDFSQKVSVHWPAYEQFILHSDTEKIHLEPFIKPAWANAIGRDQYGLWASFKLVSQQKGVVEQKLRWITPGRFLMGSREEEPGRWDDEGPQHEVVLTRGYWLFDTPVTQALYEAVTGENPSEFKSAQRPVEQVSWNDAMKFIQKINNLVPDLRLSLPTEAQWEYACRAGTTDATYAGPMEISGENNAPVLDDIAWYDGNSGVDFDLEKGYDNSDWKEKQYEHQQAGTREVRGKQANPWGLYDMLGDVWEWCEDGPREYASKPVTDPVGPAEEAADRVLRGGSWGDFAQIVRCACRFANHPENTDDFAGIRCARVHETGSGS